MQIGGWQWTNILHFLLKNLELKLNVEKFQSRPLLDIGINFQINYLNTGWSMVGADIQMVFSGLSILRIMSRC
ncbi:hypothetical protein PMA3_17075 [Pseudomonas silesiensis]|uniref:Uncharacterized protein n=1 Tax=Pseudomonas silesiensis TaxID=1853130 RepID=A0A191YVL6_9PSED|nr:hypothetical protein PMA3_17075 [Pseudomonas silesiensis]